MRKVFREMCNAVVQAMPFQFEMASRLITLQYQRDRVVGSVPNCHWIDCSSAES